MLLHECPECGWTTAGYLGLSASPNTLAWVRRFRCNHCDHVFSIPAEDPRGLSEPMPSSVQRIKGDESGLVRCLKCGNYQLLQLGKTINPDTRAFEVLYRCPGCRYTWIRTIALAY